MESNQNSFEKTISRKKKFVQAENFNYLYPNGHRMTHQMRWFKGSRDRGFRPDIAA